MIPIFKCCSLFAVGCDSDECVDETFKILNVAGLYVQRALFCMIFLFAKCFFYYARSRLLKKPYPDGKFYLSHRTEPVSAVYIENIYNMSCWSVGEFMLDIYIYLYYMMTIVNTYLCISIPIYAMRICVYERNVYI